MQTAELPNAVAKAKKRHFATKGVLSDGYLKQEEDENYAAGEVAKGVNVQFAALVSSECQPTPVHILWQEDELTLFYSC